MSHVSHAVYTVVSVLCRRTETPCRSVTAGTRAQGKASELSVRLHLLILYCVCAFVEYCMSLTELPSCSFSSQG